MPWSVYLPLTPTLSPQAGRGRRAARNGRGRRAGHLGPAFGHAAGFLGAGGAVAAQAVDAVAQVDIVAAEAALGQHGGDLGGDAAGALPARIDHHAGKPRRQRQAVEELALRRDAAGGVDSAEIGQQLLGFVERGRGRRNRETPAGPDRPPPTGRGRARTRIDRRREFPAARRVPAPRFAVRPRAGSRHPARCARRGRAADRRPPATPARFRAG